MTPTQQTHLDAFLAEHGDAVRSLLPPGLDAARPYQVESISPVFDKYTLGPVRTTPDGSGDVWAMLHHFTGPDVGCPHCHPVELFICNLAGRQVEWLYHPGSVVCPVEERVWRPGNRHHLPANAVHLIPHLPDGAAWTLAFAGPVVRQWQHYPELAELRPVAPAVARVWGRQ